MFKSQLLELQCWHMTKILDISVYYIILYYLMISLWGGLDIIKYYCNTFFFDLISLLNIVFKRLLYVDRYRMLYLFSRHKSSHEYRATLCLASSQSMYLWNVSIFDCLNMVAINRSVYVSGTHVNMWSMDPIQFLNCCKFVMG